MAQDSTYNAHNYFAHGGNELVIGGKLTFLPGATVEGGDDLFDTGASVKPAAYVSDSSATTVAALKEDFNKLLAALRASGLMAVAVSATDSFDNAADATD